MARYVADEVIKKMIRNGLTINKANILVLGITFKANCPDIRNTKVLDLIKELREFNTQVTVYDPVAGPVEVENKYNVTCLHKLPDKKYDAVILAVTHQEFKDLNINSLLNPGGISYCLTDKI